MIDINTRIKNKNRYLKAAELIETYGWIQGSFGTKFKGFCMIGAVFSVSGESPCDFDSLENVACGNGIIYANDKYFVSDTEAIIALTLAACLEDDRD